MNEDDERSAGDVGLGRTLALSDGIFAIAMTLVAFQIQAPDLRGSQVHHLGRALGHLAPEVSVFALTFFVIGAFWLRHHRLFSRLVRADEGLMALNLVFLATIAILPFPSAVLGRYGDQAAAVILYASTMMGAGVLQGLVTLLAQHRHLVGPSLSPAGVRAALIRSGTLVAVFGISIPLALVDAGVAPYLWLALVPLRFIPRIGVGSPARY